MQIAQCKGARAGREGKIVCIGWRVLQGLGGVVVVRPVQRFLRVMQVWGLAQVVVDVTVIEKLDGVMVRGAAVCGDSVELRSRGRRLIRVGSERHQVCQ